MDRTRSELTDRELAVWKGLLEAHSRIVSELDHELTAAHGLPLSSYEVLMQLADAPDGRLRMGELADRLLLSRSGITRLVDRLASHGLAARERCVDDGRGWYASLTEAGREAVHEARPDHLAGVRRHFLDRLEPGDIDRLEEVWRRLGVQSDRRDLDEAA